MWTTFVVMAVLLLAGCQKQVPVDPLRRSVVDGINKEVILYSESEWDAFMSQMMDLTDKGHEVYIVANKTCGVATKDTQTITSSDKEEVTEWAKEKHDEDYDVKIKKNQDGTYTGTAIK